MIKGLNSFFKLSDRNATIKKEIIGGITTFLAMIYILSVNPGLLSIASGSEYTGAIFLGTAISAFIATFAMGLLANVPLALAPGMGINAFFTFTVATSFGLGYGGALMSVFVSGIFYFIVAITNLRKIISQSISKNLKITISIFIGLLIGYIGLQNMGVIVSNPATLTGLGDFKNPLVIIGLLTFAVMITLYFLKIRGAIIIAMISGVIMLAITYAIIKDSNLESSDPMYHTYNGIKNTFTLNQYSDFDKFGDASALMWKDLGKTFSNPLFYVAVFTFFYVDFFDTTGTLMIFDNTLSRASWYSNDKNQVWFQRANMVDGASTVVGSLMLNSSVTTFVESTAGFKAGARTGLASVVTAFMFLLSIALWPILNPFLPVTYNVLENGVQLKFQPITGPVLVLIAILISKEFKFFDWSKSYDVVVMLIATLVGVLGFSISMGISFAFISYTFVYGLIDSIKYLMLRKNKEITLSYKDYIKQNINITMIILFLLSLTYLGLHIYLH